MGGRHAHRIGTNPIHREKHTMPGRRYAAPQAKQTLLSAEGATFPQEAHVLADCRTAHAYLTPAELAAIWRVSHDKVLEFIRTGELTAFNVASSRSRRQRFRIALAAVTEFEARRSACDAARRLSPALTRRTIGKRSPQPHNYF